jgi:hypothetical protein
MQAAVLSTMVCVICQDELFGVGRIETAILTLRRRN